MAEKTTADKTPGKTAAKFDPRTAAAFVCGLLFGIGLAVSRMADPKKVLNFLDVYAVTTGGWDPTLAFVMGGALIVAAPAFWFVRRRGKPLLAPSHSIPTARAIDKALVAGAVMFGVGWGLVGFCPGPAIAALGLGGMKAWVFFVAMLGGMAAYDFMLKQRNRGTE